MFKIKPPKKIRASLRIEGDKSISHRAVILSSLSEQTTKIINFLDSQDTLTTLEAFEELGVEIKYKKSKRELFVKGRGKYLNSPDVTLQMKNSGTTIRLISGVLSAQKFSSTLEAYPSLKRRPMRRIAEPLRRMGANIKGRLKDEEEYPPLRIKPVSFLKGIEYRLPVASAQVKSCLLLASLYAKGPTLIYEPYKSRDHTERMLKVFGAKIKVKAETIRIENSDLKSPSQIFIPNDFSSASFFIALAVLFKDSKLLLEKISLNPSRIGFLRVLKRMGAKVEFKNIRRSYFEPYADILVKTSPLKGVEVKEEEIPFMIDELPLLFVLASFAKGTTQIYGLKELRVKETDRIKSMEDNLKRMGVNFRVRGYINSKREQDLMVEIKGGTKFRETFLKSFLDHRTAMSLIIASLALKREAVIDNVACINKSFPKFLSTLRSLDK